MEIESIILDINKRKRQARQLNPNSMVVSIERAVSAIKKAYSAGLEGAINTTVDTTDEQAK